MLGFSVVAVSCTSSTSGSGSGSSVDGTWDFVASGALAKYQQGTAVVAGGSATVTFAYTIDDPGYCTYQRQLVVSVNQNASTAVATANLIDNATGSDCYPANGPKSGFFASRISTAAGFGPWGGTWQISSPDFPPGAGCTVQLAGGHATGTCTTGTGHWEGVFNLTLSNGALSGTATSATNVVQIAASKR